MSSLTIYAENQPDRGEYLTDFAAIQKRLHAVGVQFERWRSERPIADDADQQTVLEAYRDAIDQLTQQYGFQSVDVIAITPEHPDKATLREKFLAEHIHNDFEVRFFVAGKGLFYLHIDDNVYAVLCEPGDLISVPANTRHWFDMGSRPHLKCIRLFTTADGWVADFTGSDISAAFPDFDQYLVQHGSGLARHD